MHESVKVISLTPVDREQGMRQLPANSHTYVWVTILQVLIDNTYFVMRMGLCPSHRSRTKQTSLVTFNILICSQERFSMDTSNICTFCEKAACWNYQFESSHTLGGPGQSQNMFPAKPRLLFEERCFSCWGVVDR